MSTLHIKLFSSTPTSPHVLATAKQIEAQHRSDRQDAVVHLLPLEALVTARPEIERHAYATGIDPVIEKGGERK